MKWYVIPITSLLWPSSILPGSLRSEQSKRSYCIGFVAKLFLPWIDGISFKSKRSSPKRATPCKRHDVTMVDECNQGKSTWNTRVNKDFQMEKSQFVTWNSTILPLCPFTLLSEVCILHLRSVIWQLNVHPGLTVYHTNGRQTKFPPSMTVGKPCCCPQFGV